MKGNGENLSVSCSLEAEYLPYRCKWKGDNKLVTTWKMQKMELINSISDYTTVELETLPLNHPRDEQENIYEKDETWKRHKWLAMIKAEEKNQPAIFR